MSEGGERTCPLCAEEMDLTDQHLKPCKCGYEICVWCWHHIIDMAEKDETEGRCPACRAPYNKEKVVGMTAKCEKLVSEMNVEKKLKSQKGKNRSSEGRKHLGSVRVIQRNLVYIVGLPLDFADEHLLQQKDYFVQYGKVLKVSISRTAAGALQQFANSTCSVYITFSKEEEAVRCIQSVNGFVLDGKQLRACFGTTKYCHAWLRNMPCSNPDCLYLHEIGSQEDSFTKDEVVSAYTRSRVQQLTGVTNSMQPRSGNVLPPPADEYCILNSVSPGKPINRSATNINDQQSLASSAGVSPPSSSFGRSTARPAGASWGNRTSGNLPSSVNTPCSNGSLKPDTWNGHFSSSFEVASPQKVCLLQIDNENKPVPREQGAISHDISAQETVEPMNGEFKYACVISMPDSSSTCLPPDNSSTIQPFNDLHTNKSPLNPSKMNNSSIEISGKSNHNSLVATDANIKNICSDFLSMSIHRNSEAVNALDNCGAFEASNMTEEVSDADSLSNCWFGNLTKETEVDLHETEDDLLLFDNQRIKDPEVIADRSHIPDYFNSFHLSKHSKSPVFQNADRSNTGVIFDRQDVDKQRNLLISGCSSPIMSTELHYDLLSSSVVGDVDYLNLLPCTDKKSLPGKCEGEVANYSGGVREGSIISNILSLDFNSLDESLTSPQNMVKFLGETDKQQGVLGASGAWKIRNSNQSRFSFAREEENQNRVSDFRSSFDYLEQDSRQPSLCNNFSGHRSLQLDKFVSHKDFQGVSGSEADLFAGIHSHISSNKLSVSRSQISAPPGFSTPIKSPPGFSSCERVDQALGSFSGNHMLDTSSFSRNQWQKPSSNNTFSNGDIEFMDPAILEVRHGTVPIGISSSGIDMRSNFSPRLSAYEESRLQSVLQASHSSHLNERMNDLADNFSHMGDYRIRSRVMEQTAANNFSPFSQFYLHQSKNAVASNGQWNGWNDELGNNNSGTEFLRNERLGTSNFYGGYEDSKVHMPSSCSMYNRTYGI